MVLVEILTLITSIMNNESNRNHTLRSADSAIKANQSCSLFPLFHKYFFRLLLYWNHRKEMSQVRLYERDGERKHKKADYSTHKPSDHAIGIKDLV